MVKFQNKYKLETLYQTMLSVWIKLNAHIPDWLDGAWEFYFNLPQFCTHWSNVYDLYTINPADMIEMYSIETSSQFVFVGFPSVHLVENLDSI